jgi:predicted dinucleotide-binding enzyme
MTTLGIIGAGYIGTAVAKAAIAAGYDIVISNSRGPESLTDLIAELGPKARAATAEEAAEAADFALVAVPLGKYKGIPVEPLAGKVVMDANNYYPGRDGRIEALDSNESTTSELIQAHLPQSYVVKAFNNIPAADITVDGLPAGHPNRRALPIAGNDEAARQEVAAFLSNIGFDSVDLGPLSESWRVERDTPSYVKRLTADELRALTTDVTRLVQV